MAIRVDLEGKTALVTGASRGIGASIARGLSGCGARVVLADVDLAGSEALATEIEKGGGSARPLEMNVADADSLQAALQSLEGETVSILVNNAGITRDGLLMRLKDEQWDQVLAVNLTGAFRLTRALIRPMLKARWGRVVNISSVVALSGNSGQVNYAASKAGLLGMTRALAKEVAAKGITVNAVAPGFIDTAMTKDLPEKVREELLHGVPAGRLGQPEEIAESVVFLCSGEAGYITGHVLNVNGGLYM
jgi:3-oxoacyl-[acyl-carrier protein] reductase